MELQPPAFQPMCIALCQSLFLFMTEKPRQNDETTGRRCMDFVVLKQDIWKGYGDPHTPL